MSSAKKSDVERDFEDHPVNTVFIIGTGLVENGWEVFNDAIVKAFGNAAARESPIHQINALTFGLRKLHRKDGPQTKEFKDLLDLIRTLRKEIGEAFQYDPRLRLKITDENDFVTKYVRGRPLIITTNWDNLLAERYADSGQCPVLYLHGNVSTHGAIYLPTETCHEPYEDDLPERAFLSQVHSLAITALSSAERVVIWGCSLEIYDAELCTLIAECHRSHRDNGKKCEYLVIDPSTLPFKRLKALTVDGDIQHIDLSLSNDAGGERTLDGT